MLQYKLISVHELKKIAFTEWHLIHRKGKWKCTNEKVMKQFLVCIWFLLRLPLKDENMKFISFDEKPWFQIRSSKSFLLEPLDPVGGRVLDRLLVYPSLVKAERGLAYVPITNVSRSNSDIWITPCRMVGTVQVRHLTKSNSHLEFSVDGVSHECRAYVSPHGASATVNEKWEILFFEGLDYSQQ